MSNQKNLKILFVCIGNSCRSPMAESILKNLVKSYKDLNWEIDSAALRSWNVGLSPEERCIRILNENGLSSDHIARQIDEDDFEKFDYIFGMDELNMEELHKLSKNSSKSRIVLLGSYNKNCYDQIIFDPYFENGDHGFRKCYEQITESCKNFLMAQLKNID